MKSLKLITFCLAILFSFFTLAFSQTTEAECDKLYNTDFVPNYKSADLNKLKLAIDSGKLLIEKCNSVEAYREPVEFAKKQLPKMEKNYRFSSAIEKFNNSVKDSKNPNVDDAFASGREILMLEPNFQRNLDVLLTLASVGLDQVLAGNKKYIAETADYAKQAIAKMESGATSQDYGLWSYVYKTKEFPDGKANALAWMNYTIGYVMYHHQGMESEGVKYLYKALQYNSNVRKRPDAYQAIGDYYKKEYNRLDDERTAIARQIQSETNEETKKQLVEKAKEILALQKGYAERMMDAYARARANAGNDQNYKNSLYETIKILYGVRFDGKQDGIDQYLTLLISKPMPDPSTPVNPIAEDAKTASTIVSDKNGISSSVVESSTSDFSDNKVAVKSQSEPTKIRKTSARKKKS